MRRTALTSPISPLSRSEPDARRPPKQRNAASGRPAQTEADAFEEELTPGQIRELRRRMADLDDATRYVLVSQMGPRFALYYNVSDDVYVMNDARGATLFKRRKAALAVKALLRGSIRVLRCKSKRVDGIRVPILDSLPIRRRRRGTSRGNASGAAPARGL